MTSSAFVGRRRHRRVNHRMSSAKDSRHLLSVLKIEPPDINATPREPHRRRPFAYASDNFDVVSLGQFFADPPANEAPGAKNDDAHLLLVTSHVTEAHRILLRATVYLVENVDDGQ